jgi:hypothetical protein
MKVRLSIDKMTCLYCSYNVSRALRDAEIETVSKRNWQEALNDEYMTQPYMQAWMMNKINGYDVAIQDALERSRQTCRRCRP